VTALDTASSLRHVMVVGGTLGEWAALSDDAWLTLIDELGATCSQNAVPWLTLRPFGPGAEPVEPIARREQFVHGCQVIVDSSADGRVRFAEAMNRIDPADEINEASVAAVLYEPADSEPDLVVVLGEPTQLPPSLVWELAYAELAFLPVRWAELAGAGAAEDLRAAFDDFAMRRRRFGGLDDDGE
jgi:hypothetical protein